MIGLVVKQLQFGWVLAEDLQLGKNRKGSVVHTVNYSSTFNQSNIVSTGGKYSKKAQSKNRNWCVVFASVKVHTTIWLDVA